MALTKTKRILVASVANTSGSTQRGTVDLEAAYGGWLTLKMTNGTAPTTQCVCNVLVSHEATLPSAGSAGTDWKTIASYGGSITASQITEIGMPIDPSIMALEVEFTGNTGQSVTVESFLSELTSV